MKIARDCFVTVSDDVTPDHQLHPLSVPPAIIDLPSTPEELILWVVLLVIGTAITTSVKKPVGSWWDQRHTRQQIRREWYEDIYALADRIDQRFFDEYWQSRGSPNLEAVGEALEPTVHELGEKITEAPDDADSTKYFARCMTAALS